MSTRTKEALGKQVGLCARWVVLSDGGVARCDRRPDHAGLHVDSVTLVGWSTEQERSQYGKFLRFI